MDERTLDTYNSKAGEYARDWLSQPTPIEIHRIAETYFLKGGSTADIGCGSGRDTEWLTKSGFPCIGFDASEGLLSEARAQFPSLTFKYGLLPNLSEIEDLKFHNVLCETVIMHLPKAVHEDALKNLLRILKHGGVLSLSWRLPVESSISREKDGRLYESIDKITLMKTAAMEGAKCLHEASIVSNSSGKRIEQVVLSKT